MTEILYRGNDHLLEITGLINAGTQEYINSAAVTVTLYDEDDVEVAGQVWPTTMSYIASSNGNYRCVLDDALELTPGAFYTAVVSVDAGSGLKAKWELKCQCQIRR